MAIDQNSILQLLSQLQGGGGPPITPSSGLQDPSLSGLALGEQGMGFGGGGSILGGRGGLGAGSEGPGLDLLTLMSQLSGEGGAAGGRPLGQPIGGLQAPDFGAGGMLQPFPQATPSPTPLGQAGMGGGGSLGNLLALLKTLKGLGRGLPAGTASSSVPTTSPTIPTSTDFPETGTGIPTPLPEFPSEATGLPGPGGTFSAAGNIIPTLGTGIGATDIGSQAVSAPFLAGGGPESVGALEGLAGAGGGGAGIWGDLGNAFGALGPLLGAGGALTGLLRPFLGQGGAPALSTAQQSELQGLGAAQPFVSALQAAQTPEALLAALNANPQPGQFNVGSWGGPTGTVFSNRLQEGEAPFTAASLLNPQVLANLQVQAGQMGNPLPQVGLANLIRQRIAQIETATPGAFEGVPAPPPAPLKLSDLFNISQQPIGYNPTPQPIPTSMEGSYLAPGFATINPSAGFEWVPGLEGSTMVPKELIEMRPGGATEALFGRGADFSPAALHHQYGPPSMSIRPGLSPANQAQAEQLLPGLQRALSNPPQMFAGMGGPEGTDLPGTPPMGPPASPQESAAMAAAFGFGPPGMQTAGQGAPISSGIGRLLLGGLGLVPGIPPFVGSVPGLVNLLMGLRNAYQLNLGNIESQALEAAMGRGSFPSGLPGFEGGPGDMGTSIGGGFGAED